MAMAGSGGTSEFQAASGLGDAAGEAVNDHDATVALAKGDAILALHAQASGQVGSDLEPKLEALARQVLPKL